MAAIQDLRDALAAQRANTTNLTAAVARAVPIIQSADPAALDEILASINTNTDFVAAEVANLNNAMPPQ